MSQQFMSQVDPIPFKKLPSDATPEDVLKATNLIGRHINGSLIKQVRELEINLDDIAPQMSHALLSDLLWSESGHVIDADIEMNGNDIVTEDQTLNASDQISVITGDISASGATTDTGDISLTTGKSYGSGDTGDINLTTGSQAIDYETMLFGRGWAGDVNIRTGLRLPDYEDTLKPVGGDINILAGDLSELGESFTSKFFPAGNINIRGSAMRIGPAIEDTGQGIWYWNTIFLTDIAALYTGTRITTPDYIPATHPLFVESPEFLPMASNVSNINRELIISTGNSWDGAHEEETGNLTLTTGSVVGASMISYDNDVSSGSVFLATGECSGQFNEVYTGDIDIKTGEIAVEAIGGTDGSTGDIRIYSGNSERATLTGDIEIITGDSDGAKSGDITISTGYTTGDKGKVYLQNWTIPNTLPPSTQFVTSTDTGVLGYSGGSPTVYPGVGIALSTGSAWGTSITNNSTNWNTAYGWGNHADAGYLTDISGQDLSTADNTTSAFITLGDIPGVAFADLTDYPADAAGVLTNDGAGSLSWVVSVLNIDGGFANSTYLEVQNIDGGGA